MSDMPEILKSWYDRGVFLDDDADEIFTVATDPRPETVLVLHGFPGSSFDWHGVVPLIEDRLRVVTFDYLGYGFSDKPFDARYSLFEFADQVERIAAHTGVERCTLAAHDIGDSVAAELLARQNEGSLGFVIDRVVITNGSIFVDMARLTPGQQALLAMPDEVMPQGLPLEAFRPGLEATFAKPDAAEIDAMLWLIQRDDGDRLLARQIRYIEERRANQPRWTSGFADHAGPIAAVWGEQDPINTIDVIERLHAMREVDITRCPDVSHWPPLETPERVAAAILG